MYVPVTTASKHGSVCEIAEAIAHRLEDADHSADVVAPAAVESVDPYDVVVYDSAVHILQWMDKAKSFLERFAGQPETRRVWVSLIGMNGVSKHAPQDPTRIDPVLMYALMIDKHTFTGHCKPSLLSLHERSVTRLAGVVEDDFRDWSEVEAWADLIAVEPLDRDRMFWITGGLRVWSSWWREGLSVHPLDTNG